MSRSEGRCTLSVLRNTTVSTPDATEAFAITKPTVALSVSFFAEAMLIIYLTMMLMRLLDVVLSIVRAGNSTWKPMETISMLTRRKRSWTIRVTMI